MLPRSGLGSASRRLIQQLQPGCLARSLAKLNEPGLEPEVQEVAVLRSFTPMPFIIRTCSWQLDELARLPYASRAGGSAADGFGCSHATLSD